MRHHDEPQADSAEFRAKLGIQCKLIFAVIDSH